MAEDRKNGEDPPLHYEAGIPVLPGPAEREDAYRNREKIEEREYKKENQSIQRRILLTQIGLVFFGVLGSGLTLWQALVAQQSADTSQKAVLLSQKTERDARLMNEKQLAENQRQSDLTLEQMQRQTTEQQDAAAAARSAALTAQEALYSSNRAYVVTGRPDVNYAERFVTIPVENIGRAPSRKVEFVAHEVTINIADPSIGGRFDQAVERSCTRGVLQNLTSTFPQSVEIPAPQMSGTAMVGGHQLTIVAMDITYDDGFPNTKEQTFQFCMRNDWVDHLHNTTWRSCDAKLHIPALEKVDGYPNCANAGIDR